MGLAPETLNTLTELASAVGNNPNFASDLQATTSGLQSQIDSVEYTVFNEKADKFTLGVPLLWDPAFGHRITADCYTKAAVDGFVDLKANCRYVPETSNVEIHERTHQTLWAWSLAPCALSPPLLGGQASQTKSLV